MIMVEKMFLKMPRVAGRIERFYNNIVEGWNFSENIFQFKSMNSDKYDILRSELFFVTYG